jgi:F0F1-type ATP synthase membrane subunit b/b'
MDEREEKIASRLKEAEAKMAVAEQEKEELPKRTPIPRRSPGRNV